MSIPTLTTTTLTNALTDGIGRVFPLGSTTGINGAGSLTTAQSIIVCGAEAMLVQRVPVAGTVEVIRGFGGTKARAHPAGSRVYAGPRTAFAFGETGGSLPNGVVGLTGDPGHLPEYRLPLGVRCSDEAGNQHVLCDFTATVHSGVTVSISGDGLFTAAPLVATHQGAVGVVAEPTSTSDTMGWVQIYGYCSAQIASGDSAATSAMVAVAASSVSSPNAGMDAIARTSGDQDQIFGMFVTGAATTAVTSASSHTGVAVPVFLNYPYTLGYKSNVIAPTT